MLAAVFLATHRSDFTAPANPSSARRALVAGLTGIAVAIVAGVVGVELRRPRLPLPSAFGAVGLRLFGDRSVALPHRIDTFAVAGAARRRYRHRALRRVAGVPARRSRRARHRSVRSRGERARYLVERYGTDSLSYFALRNDKEWFGHRDTMVAYRVHNGIALVSPDPIGPVSQRAEAWAAFREFADDHGWPVAVMGACGDWLPVYAAERHARPLHRRRGRRRRSALQPRRASRTRACASRSAASARPATGSRSSIPPSFRRELEQELRGADDREPARRRRAWVLDDPRSRVRARRPRAAARGRVRRREPSRRRSASTCRLVRSRDGRSTSCAVPSRATIRTGSPSSQSSRRSSTSSAKGSVGLALNFATFRAVLASEAGDRLVHRVEKWFLERMSDSMQIESLWTFNEKFQPEWHPRYACYDSPEHLLARVDRGRAGRVVLGAARDRPVLRPRADKSSRRPAAPPAPGSRRRAAARARVRRSSTAPASQEHGALRPRVASARLVARLTASRWT